MQDQHVRLHEEPYQCPGCTSVQTDQQYQLFIFLFSQQSTPQSSNPGSTSPQLEPVKVKEKLANGELHSSKTISVAAGANIGIEEVDSGRLEEQQRAGQRHRYRAHTSPEQLRRHRVNRPGHVQFVDSTEQNGKGRYEVITNHHRNNCMCTHNLKERLITILSG